MSFWTRIFGKGKREEEIDSIEEVSLESQVNNEEDSNTLELGWYYSASKDEVQMAKIADEDRATHCYIIGATGAGKTKFLEFLISQDIKKRNGFGIIDPHGDLIEDVKGLLAVTYKNENDYAVLS